MCVAVCCSVFSARLIYKCVAVCCSVLQWGLYMFVHHSFHIHVCCSVLQCVFRSFDILVCCSVLQWGLYMLMLVHKPVHHSFDIQVCCSVLQWSLYMLVDPTRERRLHRSFRSGLCVYNKWLWYGVATISRLLKMIGLFCRISSLLQGSFAKETCNFKEPTNRSHPIYVFEEKGAYMFCI